MDLIPRLCDAPTKGVRRVVGVLTLLALVNISLVGCSSLSSSGSSAGGSEAEKLERTCASWQRLVESFELFDEVSISLDGVQGLEQALDRLEAAVSDLAEASDALLGANVDALGEAVGNLVDSLGSPRLSMSYLDELLEEKEAVDAAWGELVDLLQSDCPQIEVSTA